MVGLILALAFCAQAQLEAPRVPPAKAAVRYTLDDLLKLKRAQLVALYKTLGPGPIPDGDSKGRATLEAGTGAGAASQRVLGLFWQGKVFKRLDETRGELVNKILGGRAIKAKVYLAESVLDKKTSIILDYGAIHDLVIRNIRDEIRMASPGVYFGFAYVKDPGSPSGFQDDPLIFALDFNK